MTERFLSLNWHRYADLRPVLKSGVTITAHRYLGELWYVLRDPATAQHHRFTPAACRIIAGMDGERTVAALWQEALEREGENAPGQLDLQRLLMQLHAADLIASDSTPGINELDDRRLKTLRQQRARSFKNPMSIVVPLFNPDRFAARLAGFRRGCPEGIWTALYLALVLPALVIGVLMRNELFSVPSDTLLSGQNLILIALLTPLVKLWHEAGHGIVSRLYGAPVREFGLMVMAFYPMPYVDASASSAIPSKWRRIHVALAGISFEFALAALALYVWVLSEPGLVKAMALNVMLIAGVSTLVINGNPLLRYDGYYALCDLIEMPNLAQRSNRYWGYLAERHLFGLKSARPEALSRRERLAFLLYAPLAWLYRTMVVVAIAIFVAQHYLLIGILIALWSLWLSVLWPLLKLLKLVLAGERLAEVRGRAVATTLAGLGAIGLLAAIPAPLTSVAEGVVWLPETAIVRARAPGFVATTIPTAAIVDAGSPLVSLANPILEGELAVQRLKVAEAATRVQVESFADQARLVIARRELEDAVAAERRMADRVQRLALAAGVPGQLDLPTGQDLPGRYMAEGTLVGHVLPEAARTIRMVVTQDNIDIVRAKVERVDVKVSGDVGRTLGARIVREVPAGTHELPSAALGSTGSGALPVDPRDDKGLTSLSRVFQFDLTLDEPLPPRFGSRVHVKMVHGSEPVYRQVSRRIRQLFLTQFAV